MSEWKSRLKEQFGGVHVESVTDDMEATGGAKVGKEIRVEAVVNLGGLRAEDLRVELYHGSLDEDGQLSDGQPVPMQQISQANDHRVRYEAKLPCSRSGRSGYTVRIMPSHAMLPNSREMAMIRWA